MIHKLEEFYEKHSKYFPAAFFILGFVFDIFTLGRIDDFFQVIMQAVYIFICTVLIYFEYRDFEFETVKKPVVGKMVEFKDEIFHFFLGSLLSAFTLFYFKSASISNSFLFMVFMAVLLVLNEFEFFQKKGIWVKSALYKLCVLSFFLYFTPLLLGQVGILIFALSIVLSGLWSFNFVKFLRKRNIDEQRIKRELIVPHGLVLFSFVALYFFKLVPPVPLSIQEIGIYHKVEKQKGQYLLAQQTPLWKFWSNGDQDFQAKSGDKVYVFMRLFAPSGFDDKLFIKWQYINKFGEWATTDRIPLKVIGGRGKGFRGYAFKSNYAPGEWRVVTETAYGLEIGRINFTVSKAIEKEEPILLYQQIR